MKMIIVACALVAVAVAAPPSVPDAESKVVRSEFNQAPEGSYVFSFETDNGINRDETGEVREAPDEENKLHPVVVVRGSYSYIDADGKPETITYYADETGFHAEGPSIPVAPVAVV